MRNKSAKINRPALYSLFTLLVTWVFLAMMLMLYLLGLSTFQKHVPQVDAVFGTKIELLNAHLWLEEVLSGDRREDIDKVWSHFDQAKNYVHALLNGDEIEPAGYIPPISASFQADILSVYTHLHRLEALSRKRYENFSGSQIGSREDLLFDRVFSHLQKQIELLEQNLLLAIRDESRRFDRLSYLILFVGFIGSLLISFIVYKIQTQKEQIEIIENEKKQLLQEEKSHLEQEVMQRTAAYRLAKEEAESASKMKSIFLANMSHELRTPMHAILSFTNLALKKLTDPKLAHYLENVKKSSQRLTALLNGLLDLSKLESGKLDIRFDATDLAVLIQDCLQQMESQFREKMISVRYEPPGSCFCEVDKQLISRVVMNLLSNAVKFSPLGGTVWIELDCDTAEACDDQAACARVSIIDEGNGIRADAIEKIFDQFAQSSEARADVEGSGLGLAISRQIVLVHPGEIRVESPPDNRSSGSAFRVLFHWSNRNCRPVRMAEPLTRPHQAPFPGRAFSINGVPVAAYQVSCRSHRQFQDPAAFPGYLPGWPHPASHRSCR